MNKSRLILVVLYSLFVIAWAVVGFKFIPNLIVDAYHGRSLPIFNAVIESQDVHPLEHYLNVWGKLYVFSLFLLVVIPPSLVFAKNYSPTFFNRFVHTSTPECLGAIRFWVFLILTIDVLWADLPSISYLPGQLRGRMGIMSLFHKVPGWDEIYTDYTALVLFKIATCVSLILAMIGFKSRFSVPFAAILTMLHGGILREYTHLYHTGLLPLQLAFALAFLPCGDGFSLDRYLSREKSPGTTANLISYGWSRYLCWVIISGAYFSAGLTKIVNGGLLWWYGVRLKMIVLQSTLNRPMHFELGLAPTIASLPIFFFSMLGLSAVLIELLYGLVLFSKLARIIIPMLTVGLHVGIWLFQGVFFYDLILLQALFFNFEWLLPSRLRQQTPGENLQSNSQTNLQHQKWSYACLFVVLAISVILAKPIEWYPVTAWQMFSDIPQSEEVKYIKVIAVHENGHKEEVCIDKLIGALTDTRYRDILMKGPKDRAAFFEAVAQVARWENDQIVGFEMHTYKWNFISEPDDPNFGKLTKIVSYPALNRGS